MKKKPITTHRGLAVAQCVLENIRMVLVYHGLCTANALCCVSSDGRSLRFTTERQALLKELNSASVQMEKLSQSTLHLLIPRFRQRLFSI